MKEGRKGGKERGGRERERERGERSVLTTCSTHLKEPQGETKSNTFCEASKTTKKSENLKILNFSFFCRRAPSRKIGRREKFPKTPQNLSEIVGTLSKHKILKKGPFFSKVLKFHFSQKFSKMLKISQQLLELYQNIKFSKEGHFSQMHFLKNSQKWPFLQKEAHLRKKYAENYLEISKIFQNVWCSIKTQNSLKKCLPSNILTFILSHKIPQKEAHFQKIIAEENAQSFSKSWCSIQT